MKKIVAIISVILIMGVLYIVFFRVNRENIDYDSKYAFFNQDSILKNGKTFVVIVTSSGCPGNKETMPKLAKNLKQFKQYNIPYYIVSDELYNEDVDNCLESFKKEYSVNEQIYLMDKNKYPVNGGLFNNKKRYKDFITDLTGNDKILLGYVNYLIFNESKFVDYTMDFTDKELKLLRNR